MSLDRSLKTAGNLRRHRNVLTRAERIEALKTADKWGDGRSVYDLPKVGHRKAAVAKKAAKTTDEAAAATPAAAPAKGAKGAAPAAAAPAAKAGDKKPAAKK